MFGTHPRIRDDPSLKEMIDKELLSSFENDRDEIRERAKDRIQKTQEENRKGYNRKRKSARQYKEGDLVAIERTQRSPGQKFAAKFLGPYEISRILRNDRYLVRKVGDHEGPGQTSTAADHIKPWETYTESEDEEPGYEGAHSRANERAGRPNVGSKTVSAAAS